MAQAGDFVLSDEQRAVVEHPPDGGNLLVLAAPGSGKTRVIVERIRWLTAEQGVAPESILAMTFTRRAAGELVSRLEGGPGEVWAGTFHAVCVDLLESLGDRAGAPLPLRVADDDRQRRLLARAAASSGLVLVDDRRDDRAQALNALQRDVSALRMGRPRRQDAALAETARWYERWLREAGLLDFDDLILLASRALDRGVDLRPERLRQVRHLFVDEFHDVSPAQDRLIRAIAPPGGEVTVSVVADRDQAIFGFLDARLEALDAFQRDYRPVSRQLSVNYRSTSRIVAAARALMKGDGASRPITARPGAEEGHPPWGAGYDDRQTEAENVVRLVQRCCRDGGFAFGDIAVLYRTHIRAHVAERALLAAGIPVHRVQQGRFFAQEQVRDVLRLLDLALAMRDEGFRNALNWPRAAVDEVSMARLRRLARAEGIGLPDLARTADLYADEIGPLTRAALRDLVTLIDSHLQGAADDPLDQTVRRLLPALAARRSPFPHRPRPIGAASPWDDLLERTGAWLDGHVSALVDAIRRGRRIALSTDGSADALAAQAILARVMETYLDRPALLLPAGRSAPDGAFAVELGRRVPPGFRGFGLARAETASIALQAWRIGQRTLMRFEQLDDGPFVLFDTETGGRDPNRCELLEVACVRFERREPAGEFIQYVRPTDGRAISGGSLKVHGITWEQVRDAPGPAETVPKVLAAFGDAMVAGHNIEQFDLVVLARYCRELGLPPPDVPTIDTVSIARRLYPDAPGRKLEDLIAGFALSDSQEHRALDDALLNAEVFFRLIEVLNRDRELNALVEALPLVAASLHVAGIPIRDDAADLVLAGARAAWLGQGSGLLAAWAESAGPEGAGALAWLRAADRGETEDDLAWEHMATRWRRVAADFAASSGDASLRAFLRYAALAESIDVAPGVAAGLGEGDARALPEAGRVAMMTAHTAKGKEWPVVIVIGAETGQFPLRDRYPNREELEEERRVLYVALTRARQRLFILWTAEGDRGECVRSPFLDGVL
ncbi:MAG: UvrD-helicase domain-containing protein [Chloroflexota bacterium]